MSIIKSLLELALALALFVAILWLYNNFGRAFVTLSGWSETVAIGVILWAIKDSVRAAASNIAGILNVVKIGK